MIKTLISLASLLMVSASGWASGLPPDRYSEWTQDREGFVPMRDGVHLSTTIVRPRGADGRLPTVLLRAPYDDTSKLFGQWLWLDFLVKHGYSVVLQDERGRGFSEGDYQNFLQNARTDGYDTLEWITHQPWSNGKVGTLGCSDSGDVQWPLAAANHPSHAAMIPAATWAVGDVPGNATQGTFYRGGVPVLGTDAWAFSYITPRERLVLPPHTTQEERIRLRNSYSGQFLFAKDFFHTPGSSVFDEAPYRHLPSEAIARALGGVRGPYDDYITWSPADPRWKQIEFIGKDAAPRVPALMLSSWHDLGVGETTRLFQFLQAGGSTAHHLVIGAGPHCSYFGGGLAHLTFDDLEVGDARYQGRDDGYQSLVFDWFEHWLNGVPNTVTDLPPVQLYVMNRGWLSGDRWPLPGTVKTPYYLGHGAPSGTLLRQPSRQSGEDGYVYDPGSPIPSLSGGDSMAARDQRPVEARRDVLLYTTPTLDTPVTMAGPIDVVLYVSSSARDTDFIVKLIDVYPSGKAIQLSDDAFRVRYRKGFDRKSLMQPGTVYEINLTNMVTGIRFPPGHRIRIDVSSSSFPEYERNLNTGGHNYDESIGVVAENAVHYGPKYPSRIVLPVIPE